MAQCTQLKYFSVSGYSKGYRAHHNHYGLADDLGQNFPFLGLWFLAQMRRF